MENYDFSGYFEALGFKVLNKEERAVPKEGDLFKIITAHGKTFELYYGYYEEIDRHSKYNEPVEIYPNFIENPVYTDEGIPFVTAMQDPCKHYKSKRGKRDEDDTCSDCTHYEKCEELLGICTCKARRNKPQDI